jgi:hypothetical protein
MCPIPNGFRDKVIPLYTSKIVDKKEILRTVSNTRSTHPLTEMSIRNVPGG